MVDQPAPEDLTARARIRDAALHLFAERGIAGATIRDIAAAAGVSSGLVRHHFGSKEALRDACDTYATERMDRLRQEIFAEGRMSDAGFMGAMHPTAMLLQNYLIHSLMDGSPTAEAMFERMVEAGERYLAVQKIESRDPRVYSAVLCAMQMGVFLMREQLSRTLGMDVGSPRGHLRMNRGMVEIFSQPLVTPDQSAALHAAMDQVEAEQPDSRSGDATRGGGGEGQ